MSKYLQKKKTNQNNKKTLEGTYGLTLLLTSSHVNTLMAHHHNSTFNKFISAGLLQNQHSAVLINAVTKSLRTLILQIGCK